MPPFDPDAAAQPGSGIFGLPYTRAESRVVLIPVPFDATTSYRRGTCDGPAAIFDASAQVDLYDPRLGKVYERGIYMMDEVQRLRELSDEAGELAADIIDRGGAGAGDAAALKKINAAGEEVNRFVEAEAAKVHKEGRIPGIIGGEHSVPFGAIKAAAAVHPGLGILHVDAHMDFRDAFEGFTWSHASIMFNVMNKVPGVAKIVQVGIRDFGERELAFARGLKERCVVHFDHVWQERLLEGERYSALVKEAVDALPEKVYISFDIDALDPSLCPTTGTPVPGGMSFQQAAILLEAVKKSGRTVVGFDLVEVGPAEDEWDANVGARLLYKLCGVV